MGRRARGGWTLVKRGRWYHVSFRIAGKQHRRATGCSAARGAAEAADRIWREAVKEAEAAEQRGPAAKETLAVTVTRWLSAIRGRRSEEWFETLKLYARVYWLPRWDGVDAITAAEVDQYIADRMREVKPATVRKELSGLRRLLTWSQRQGLLAEVPRWDAPTGRSDHVPRCYTRAEVHRLLGYLPTAQQHPGRRHVLPYFAAMWGQGFRAGTIHRLRWDDVDFAAGTITVRASADKRKHDRVVPLAVETAWALRSLPRGVGLVFGRRDYRAQLDRAAERAGLGKVRCHDLRHSRLTYWAEVTHDVASLQHMAGHRDLASTVRYVHGRVERARRLLEAEEQS